MCIDKDQQRYKKVDRPYRQETQDIINNMASGLHTHFPESHKVEDDDDKRINASLLLQIISGKYINTLHELIDYTYKGEKLTIMEQVKQKVDHATSVEVYELFPTPAVMDNVYYVTGFLGNQADKEATRRAKDSGVRLCLEHIAKEKFLVRNRGQEVGVNALIEDKDMPTTKPIINQPIRVASLLLHTI